MSHRQSCDRCRQQKVRCLRDELPSQGQTLPPCERCAKAGVACVYSLRQRARRPTEGRRDTNADSEMTGFGQALVGVFSRDGALGSELGDLAGQFPAVDEGTGFDGWDTNLHLFPPISPLPLAAPADDALRDGDAEIMFGDEDEDAVEVLTSQLIALSQRVMRTMRFLGRPGSAPLTVSSPQVNEAFEDTNTLIRIINNIAAAWEADKGQPVIDDGLVFLALASHQHLLALSRAICNAINRCLESIPSGNEHQQRGLHGDGPSSVAQFVMVLQLLMHLINRVDRSLFQSRVNSESGGQVTPVTPSDRMYPLLVEAEESKGSQALPVLGQAIVRTLPDQHVKLRHVIQELQTRIERSEYI